MRNAPWDSAGSEMGQVLPVLCVWCEELHLSQVVGFELRVCLDALILMKSCWVQDR